MDKDADDFAEIKEYETFHASSCKLKGRAEGGKRSEIQNEKIKDR